MSRKYKKTGLLGRVDGGLVVAAFRSTISFSTVSKDMKYEMKLNGHDLTWQRV